nr:hypothetical protein [Pedobacter sp. ASV2]
MTRRPPRSTLKLCRRQRQMCIRDSTNTIQILDILDHYPIGFGPAEVL